LANLFGNGATGWQRVNICDFVHGHISLSYAHANNTIRQSGVQSQIGGFVVTILILAVNLLSLPEYNLARYCMGYLSDIWGATALRKMDFAALV